MNYITRSIKVGVKLKTTLPTLEQGLAFSVIPMSVSTVATSLRSVASVNILNITTMCHRLVSKELLKLKKVPLIYFLALLFTQCFLTSHSLFGSEFHCSTTNTSKFLQNNSSSCFQSSNNLLCNTMVDVLPHKPFALLDFQQVCLCGASAFALQITPQPLISFTQLFNSSPTKKPVITNDRKFLYSSVYTNEFATWNNIFAFFLKDDMQKCFTFNLKQVGRTFLPSKVLLEVFWNEDGKSHPAVEGQDVDRVVREIHRQTSVIIPDGATPTLWARFTFLGSYTSKGLRCLNSCRNYKLAFQSCVFSGLVVSKMVQSDAVELLVVPSSSANKVKSICVSLNCWLKHLFINFQLYFNGSCLFHIPIVYMSIETDFYNKNLIILQEAGIPPTTLKGRGFLPEII